MANDEFGFGAGSGYQTGQSANVTFGGKDEPLASDGPSVATKDISTAEFMPEVIEASKHIPVLIDFWAPWCGPCKQLTPSLEAAVAATRGKVKLVKMDIDKHPEVAGQMGIQSIPAVVAFVDGKPADAFMGAKSEGEIREFIAKITGPDEQDTQIDEMLEKADELVKQGAVGEAGNIYGHILTIEPDNLRAISAVGHLYLGEKNLDGAKGVISALSDKQLQSLEITSLRTAIELAEQAEDIGELTGLEAEVEKTPDDHQKRLNLAIALNAEERREEAADHLLEIIRKKPGWNDDAARNQLLQFFEAWGMTDEVTVASRRKLSSLLFS